MPEPPGLETKKVVALGIVGKVFFITLLLLLAFTVTRGQCEKGALVETMILRSLL